MALRPFAARYFAPRVPCSKWLLTFNFGIKPLGWRLKGRGTCKITLAGFAYFTEFKMVPLSRGPKEMQHRILIIDDEDDIREVAALSLETVAGWQVFVANSGSQGLARAIDLQPDAILLDVMMPGMDGPTTFRELRKNPATARIPGPCSPPKYKVLRPAPLRRSGCRGHPL